jgi:hypothetical protein
MEEQIRFQLKWNTVTQNLSVSESTTYEEFVERVKTVFGLSTCKLVNGITLPKVVLQPKQPKQQKQEPNKNVPLYQCVKKSTQPIKVMVIGNKSEALDNSINNEEQRIKKANTEAEEEVGYNDILKKLDDEVLDKRLIPKAGVDLRPGLRHINYTPQQRAQHLAHVGAIEHLKLHVKGSQFDIFSEDLVVAAILGDSRMSLPVVHFLIEQRLRPDVQAYWRSKNLEHYANVSPPVTYSMVKEAARHFRFDCLNYLLEVTRTTGLTSYELEHMEEEENVTLKKYVYLLNTAVTSACEAGHLKLLKWLHNAKQAPFGDVLEQSLRNNRPRTLQYLIDHPQNEFNCNTCRLWTDVDNAKNRPTRKLQLTLDDGHTISSYKSMLVLPIWWRTLFVDSSSPFTVSANMTAVTKMIHHLLRVDSHYRETRFYSHVGQLGEADFQVHMKMMRFILQDAQPALGSIQVFDILHADNFMCIRAALASGKLFATHTLFDIIRFHLCNLLNSATRTLSDTEQCFRGWIKYHFGDEQQPEDFSLLTAEQQAKINSFNKERQAQINRFMMDLLKCSLHAVESADNEAERAQQAVQRTFQHLNQLLGLLTRAGEREAPANSNSSSSSSSSSSLTSSSSSSSSTSLSSLASASSSSSTASVRALQGNAKSRLLNQQEDARQIKQSQADLERNISSLKRCKTQVEESLLCVSALLDEGIDFRPCLSFLTTEKSILRRVLVKRHDEESKVSVMKSTLIFQPVFMGWPINILDLVCQYTVRTDGNRHLHYQLDVLDFDRLVNSVVSCSSSSSSSSSAPVVLDPDIAEAQDISAAMAASIIDPNIQDDFSGPALSSSLSTTSSSSSSASAYEDEEMQAVNRKRARK